MASKHRTIAIALLGTKGIICLMCLTGIALALVTYTATVTVNPARQFTIGKTTQSWSVYINDVNS
jgi:hypothetical protein